MKYPMVVWLARLFFLATLACFAVGIFGNRPELLKSTALLALMFLFLAIRARQLRPRRL